MNLLQGKCDLVVEIAHEHSIASGCGHAFKNAGAELAIRHCHVNTTATQQYMTSPFITPQQLWHPTGSLLQFGTGAMFFVRSDGVGR